MSVSSRRTWVSLAAYCAAACLGGAVPSVLHADEAPQGGDNSGAYGVLQKNCFPCHGAAKTSGLDLRSQESALMGGSHGSVIVAGDPDQSRLYKLVTHVAEPAMP